MRIKLLQVNYKNGEEETLDRGYISELTYQDLRTKGSKAKKNLMRTLKNYVWGELEDITSIVVAPTTNGYETINL